MDGLIGDLIVDDTIDLTNIVMIGSNTLESGFRLNSIQQNHICN